MRIAVLATAAVFFATAAMALPTDPSPDSGLKGVWRIIGATPAPWTKPRRLSKSDTPLLEFAVDFEDGVVKGPAPLGCAKALYAEPLDPPFGGKLSAKDSKALHMVHADITYRVICGSGVRDYTIDDDANMRMEEGGVIYTLQRPTGMEPNRYEAGFSGPSFDCTKAKSAADKILCTDANLSETDRKLSVAYDRLKKTETPESFATVQGAQRGWLAYVLKVCKANGALPEDQGAKNDIQECLSDNYGDRADRLHAIAVVKSGGITLEPRMRFASRMKPATEDSDICPWMVGGTSANAFNAWAAKALQLSKLRMDDKNLFAFTPDQVGDLKLSARRTYSVVRLDDRIVSFQAATFDYTGGAHEAIGEIEYNWDMRAQRPLRLDDVFAPGKDWKKFITDYCLKDLTAQFKEQQNEAPKREDVAATLKDEPFLFGTKGLTVHFTVYTVTSFAGGEYDVDIPYAALKPYMKPGAPVL